MLYSRSNRKRTAITSVTVVLLAYICYWNAACHQSTQFPEFPVGCQEWMTEFYPIDGLLQANATAQLARYSKN